MSRIYTQLSLQLNLDSPEALGSEIYSKFIVRILFLLINRCLQEDTELYPMCRVSFSFRSLQEVAVVTHAEQRLS